VDALLRRQPQRIRVLHLQAGRDDKRLQALAELAANQGVVIRRSPRAELDTMAAGRHQGAIAEVSQQDAGDELAWSEAQLLAAIEAAVAPPLLLVLDGVTDPHNLGACLRSADAAGVMAVVIPRDRAVGLTPVVRKVASGAAESIPVVQVTNLARTLDALRAAGVWIFGADGAAPGSIFDHDLTGPVAIALGSEGEGLRRLTRERCDYLVALPMAGSVSSLNVSVATGVCLFEAVRQRRPRPTP